MPTRWTLLESPLGALRIVATADAVTAIDFMGDPPDHPHRAPRDARSGTSVSATSVSTPSVSAPSVSAAEHAARARGRPVGERADDDPLLKDAAGQLQAYFARELRAFDLPLAPHGSAFQLRVWEQLRAIGYGEVATYGAIAGRLGLGGRGARAVGLANGRNPIPVVVPCHRVVGADGSLTGYGGGLARKQLLLDLETDSLF